MTKVHRNFIAPVAALLVCVTFNGVLRAQEAPPAEPENPTKAQLEQVVETILAVAKTSIPAAKSDAQAIDKTQQTVAALTAIGQLGDFSTSAQSDKLLEELAADARPALVDYIVQTQLTSKLQQWPQVDENVQKALVNRFVDHVKKSTITKEHTAMLSRISRTLDHYDQGKLAAEAINALLPQIQASDDAIVKRQAAGLEGIVRRLDLVGKPLELEGKLLDGSAFDWNSYRGKVVLIDFHASWCGPCRHEVPNVLKNYQAFHDKGFEVVGINMDTDPKLAQKYIDETGAKFPTIYSDDPAANGWKAPLAVKYGINAIPRVILVDKDGNVISTNARGDKLGPMLEKLLGPPAEVPDADAEKSSDTAIPSPTAQAAQAEKK